MIPHERLCNAISVNNWNLIIDLLKPKYFPRDENGILIDRKILAKVAETLTTPRKDVPPHIQIVLLKCLVNSCIDGFTNEKYIKYECDDEMLQNNCNKLYALLSRTDYSEGNEKCFPYEGIVGWAVNYVFKHIDDFEDSKEVTEIFRLIIQFLCNLSTFACEENNLPPRVKSDEFKSAVAILTGSKRVPVRRAACAFVHNALKNFDENYYNEIQMKKIAENLVEANKLGIESAGESLILFLKRSKWLQKIYNHLSIESKLYLLEIIHQDARQTVYSESNNEKSTNFSNEVIQFLAEKFRKRSDLILKTVHSHLDGMEPMEITLLLDVIGVISSKDSIECRILKNDKSLVINCIFLLKSVHAAGKESENYFTPMQKLSDVAGCNVRSENSSKEDDIQNHPAFGFKAGLIRVIGNLVHRHKENLDLIRETDAIPLLLDCCNIDARNPLIMQWAIFALRNACENSPENQEIIRNCNRVGIIDNDIIREMGIKLNEEKDGKAIGIVPLPRNK